MPINAAMPRELEKKTKARLLFHLGVRMHPAAAGLRLPLLLSPCLTSISMDGRTGSPPVHVMTFACLSSTTAMAAASLFCLMWPWLPDGMHRACMQLASDTPLSSFHGGRRRLCSSETTTTTCRRSNRCERQEKTMDTTQGFCCASVHVNASHIYGMDMLAIFPCQYVYSWILASWREYELHLGMTLA